MTKYPRRVAFVRPVGKNRLLDQFPLFEGVAHQRSSSLRTLAKNLFNRGVPVMSQDARISILPQMNAQMETKCIQRITHRHLSTSSCDFSLFSLISCLPYFFLNLLFTPVLFRFAFFRFPLQGGGDYLASVRSALSSLQDLDSRLKVVSGAAKAMVNDAVTGRPLYARRG